MDKNNFTTFEIYGKICMHLQASVISAKNPFRKGGGSQPMTGLCCAEVKTALKNPSIIKLLGFFIYKTK